VVVACVVVFFVIGATDTRAETLASHAMREAAWRGGDYVCGLVDDRALSLPDEALITEKKVCESVVVVVVVVVVVAAVVVVVVEVVVVVVVVVMVVVAVVVVVIVAPSDVCVCVCVCVCLCGCFRARVRCGAR